jgi:hypothetical protein
MRYKIMRILVIVCVVCLMTAICVDWVWLRYLRPTEAFKALPAPSLRNITYIRSLHVGSDASKELVLDVGGIICFKESQLFENIEKLPTGTLVVWGHNCTPSENHEVLKSSVAIERVKEICKARGLEFHNGQ